MVNFGPNSASILGIFLAVAGAALYFIRTIRPELSRDHDIFFAAVGILCGLILLFQGWRLDPILQFGQFLLTGSAIFFAVESIRLRGIATEQARRNTPIVDDDRPVSRVYRAELDQLEPYEAEDEYENRRLRGYSDSRPSRRSSNDIEEPRSKSRRSSDPYSSGGSSRENARPRRRTNPPPADYDQWDNNPKYPPTEENNPPRRSKKRPKPSTDLYRDEAGVPPTDYVDYQPIDQSDSNKNNDSDWEQPSTRERKKPRVDTDNPNEFDY